jgi:hypothetical protein
MIAAARSSLRIDFDIRRLQEFKLNQLADQTPSARPLGRYH